MNISQKEIEHEIIRNIAFFSNIIVLVLTLLLHKDRRIIPLLIASGTATLIMFIHWAAEGYRIQLLLLYGVTMMLLAVSMYHYVKRTLCPESRASSGA